jgi:cytochrome c oxidase assembly protein subunit 11
MSRRNRRVGLWLGGVVVLMVGLAFASVPLYRLFCQVTGFGGTPMLVEKAPDVVADRVFTIRFDANVAPDLDWEFVPEQQSVQVRAGEPFLAYYRATNRSNQPIVGTSTYNVTPLKVGKYFSKIACFCFTQQPLAAGQTARLPLQFFVDPAIVNDPHLREVTTITMSYTFFRDKNPTVASVSVSPASAPATTTR